MNELEYMDPQEFIDGGYLQELNRRFLHPLGLALEVGAADGPEFIGRIWDCRDEDEGIHFEGGYPDFAKFAQIEKEWRSKSAVRQDALGYMVQPVPQSAVGP